MEESKYKPFDKDTYDRIVFVVGTITDSFDEKYADELWSWCTTIRGKHTKRPCTCGSAGKYWGMCVEDIRKWIDERYTKRK